MHDVAHVQEGQTAKNVVDQFDQMVLGEINLMLEQRVQVCVDEFDDEANVHQIVVLALRTFAPF